MIEIYNVVPEIMHSNSGGIQFSYKVSGGHVTNINQFSCKDGHVVDLFLRSTPRLRPGPDAQKLFTIQAKIFRQSTIDILVNNSIYTLSRSLTLLHYHDCHSEMLIYLYGANQLK